MTDRWRRLAVGLVGLAELILVELETRVAAVVASACNAPGRAAAVGVIFGGGGVGIGVGFAVGFAFTFDSESLPLLFLCLLNFVYTRS